MMNKSSELHICSQLSGQAFECAAAEMNAQSELQQQRAEATLFRELSECTCTSGIPRELQMRTRQEIESLQHAATELEHARKNAVHTADELKARLHDTEKAVYRSWYRLNPPANSIIDREEQIREHFTSGLSLYKIALVFIIGSFAGVVVETLWCLLRHGCFESRNGVVWGPFSPLYGLGAVALTLSLYRFRNRGPYPSFIGGFVIGSVVEYICSWWQEWAFGSRSWDYSGMPFNINGRVCLLYSVFWGILGVFWIKDIYPRMSKWILKLPNRSGKMITCALTIFMAVNCLVSGLAVLRWSERLKGIPADSACEVFLDQRFPDERLSAIYANMDFSSIQSNTEGEKEQ